MAIALPEILQPGPFNKLISRLKVNNTRLQNAFAAGGMDMQPGRNFGYDIFNETRDIAVGRTPATGPATVPHQPVGRVNGTFPRFHEKKRLLYEQIHNLRPIGGGWGQIDKRGLRYIEKQAQILKQKYTNAREFFLAGMLRGQVYYVQDGDSLKYYLSNPGGNSYTIDFQIPAGNKGQLDMLGDGAIIDTAWDNAAALIVDHCLAVNAAMENLLGRALRQIWVTSVMWSYVINNTQVKALAGTVNTPYDIFDRVGQNDFVGRLRALPWLEWHITDGVLNDGGGNTVKIIDDTAAVFMPDIESSWYETLLGSEVVVEYENGPATEQFGQYFYARQTTDPAGYDMYALDNHIPSLLNPSCIAYATVDF